MAYFIVQGGKKLKGSIKVNGAKNGALKSLAASLLFKDEIKITNVPRIEDVFRAEELLRKLGCEVAQKNGVVTVNPEKIKTASLDPEIAKRFRASIVFIGPLLARKGNASFPHPGGCVIGKRPIDLFLEGWRAMGSKIEETKNGYTLSAPRLMGCDFTFRNISVTGTETLMMTATLAKGKTILRNAASEPEISALAKFLNMCGAKIKGAGTHAIEIQGTGGRPLEAKGKTMQTIPDRIEAGSFLALGALLGDPLRITNCDPEHLEVPIQTLKAMGVPLKKGESWIEVSSPKKLKSVDIKTREYPGFPTDLQSLFALLLTQAEGESLVHETVFEGRLNYAEDLNRMGAKITVCDLTRALVRGKTPLRAREIESPDIRAGLAFLGAALIAKGESRINNIYQIDRGYERIEERLNKLGAEITRVNS
ncbi:MAG: UDP-N-acetylglucosamine 1-carboxyvinyltransferase [Nanoarchaeota archaeon]|nr:UDP-N-acetylglucosamine 1-carboxyvinyltransferase [Nanoarchaeota archaeon]